MLSIEERLEIFKDELRLIEFDHKGFVREILTTIPDYFFDIPASSTGKYHPQYTLGQGGLIRHTKASIKIAYDLFNLEYFTFEEKSIIISALLLHDGCKSGRKLQKYGVHEHPVLMVDLIREQNIACGLLMPDTLNILCGAIASHMGKWNTNVHSLVVLPIPQTSIERFVHLCDYLASRKFIEILFNIDGRP